MKNLRPAITAFTANRPVLYLTVGLSLLAVCAVSTPVVNWSPAYSSSPCCPCPGSSRTHTFRLKFGHLFILCNIIVAILVADVARRLSPNVLLTSAPKHANAFYMLGCVDNTNQHCPVRTPKEDGAAESKVAKSGAGVEDSRVVEQGDAVDLHQRAEDYIARVKRQRKQELLLVAALAN